MMIPLGWDCAKYFTQLDFKRFMSIETQLLIKITYFAEANVCYGIVKCGTSCRENIQ